MSESAPKKPRRRRKPVTIPELRQLAARRLLERLEQDSLSPGDLLKVVQYAEEGDTQALPPGDWLLRLAEGPGSAMGEDQR